MTVTKSYHLVIGFEVELPNAEASTKMVDWVTPIVETARKSMQGTIVKTMTQIRASDTVEYKGLEAVSIEEAN
jgi:hypothetical protein